MGVLGSKIIELLISTEIEPTLPLDGGLPAKYVFTCLTSIFSG